MFAELMLSSFLNKNKPGLSSQSKPGLDIVHKPGSVYCYKEIPRCLFCTNLVCASRVCASRIKTFCIYYKIYVKLAIQNKPIRGLCLIMGELLTNYSPENHEVITSPTRLAQIRADISKRALLATPTEFSDIERNAVAQGLFCPDELACLQDMEVALPEPWSLGKTISRKYLPENVLFNRMIEGITPDPGIVTGFVFASMDGPNSGHVGILNKAKEQCDQLVLVLDSDLIMASLKSKPEDIRPKLPQYQRAFMAAQIDAVDWVYFVPRIDTLPHALFEIFALIKHNKKLGIKPRFNPRVVYPDTERLKSICAQVNFDLIQRTYGLGYGVGGPRDLLFDSLCSYLGFDRQYLDDSNNEYSMKGSVDYRWYGASLAFPKGPQLSYQLFWISLYNALENIKVFVSDHDPVMAQLHIEQANNDAFNDPPFRFMEAVKINSTAPNTSSTQLFRKHPQLQSEALKDAAETLAILKRMDQENGTSLYSDWGNPLLPKLNG